LLPRTVADRHSPGSGPPLLTAPPPQMVVSARRSAAPRARTTAHDARTPRRNTDQHSPLPRSAILPTDARNAIQTRLRALAAAAPWTNLREKPGHREARSGTLLSPRETLVTARRYRTPPPPRKTLL